MEVVYDMDHQLIQCIVSSSVIVAIITTTKDLILWGLNRKAKKSDDADGENSKLIQLEEKVDSITETLEDQNKADEKLAETLDKLAESIDISLSSSQLLMKDKIKQLTLKYLARGSVSYSEREDVHKMWEMYHYKLKGNGDLNQLMEDLDELPLEDVQDIVRGY